VATPAAHGARRAVSGAERPAAARAQGLNSESRLVSSVAAGPVLVDPGVGGGPGVRD